MDIVASNADLLQPHSSGRKDILPLRGRLAPLQTKAEAQARLQLIDAYVIEVPSKSANTLLRYDCLESGLDIIIQDY